MDKELLWKAWPAGYLAVRGVSTVSGWLCTGQKDGKPTWDEDRNTYWHTMVKSNALKAGDLLPNVDQDDTASWACLLKDLLSACWCEDQLEPERWQIVGWRPCLVPAVPNPSSERDADWQPGWALDYSSGIMCVVTYNFGFPIDLAGAEGVDLENGAALALVLTRIQLREKEDENAD